MIKGLFVLLAFSSFSLLCGEEIKHRFLAMDNYKKAPQLIYVDQLEPENSWITKLPSIKGGTYRSIQKIDAGRLLINHPDGAGEYDLRTGQPLKWKVSGLTGVQCALRLPNGNTAIASTSNITFVDESGKIISKKSLDGPPKGRMRLLTLTSRNTLFYSSNKPYSLCEITLEGEFIKAIPLIDKGYKHILLANGNILNSTGDTCKVIEMSPAGKVVHFVGGKAEHPTYKLDFCSGWELLANGNIVMTNWLGHNKVGAEKQLFEFDQDNKLVWSWDGRDLGKTITNVLVLD